MKKVLVGMSGGVDSSVTALLLKKKGYEVIGVTLDLVKKTDSSESETVNDAKKVCDKLGIEYHMLDFQNEFKKKVIDYFAKEYMEGRTPNPCIACNRYIKFEELLNKALTVFDCDYISTGHYAKVDYDEIKKRYFLRKSATQTKDQTYVLYNLTQEQLSHTLMPLGEYTKDEVRKIAEENGLINAKRKDSQEICFVEDNDYAGFIQDNYGYISKKGNFIDVNGNKMGEHQGIINYTIGQRKGLGIALGKHQYVIRFNLEKNEIVIGNEEFLFSDKLICKDLNFMTIENLDNPVKLTAKIRYSAKDVPAVIHPISDEKAEVIFEEKQRAITPGQAVVFYDGDKVIGGGIII